MSRSTKSANQKEIKIIFEQVANLLGLLRVISLFNMQENYFAQRPKAKEFRNYPQRYPAPGYALSGRIGDRIFSGPRNPEYDLIVVYRRCGTCICNGPFILFQTTFRHVRYLLYSCFGVNGVTNIAAPQITQQILFH